MKTLLTLIIISTSIGLFFFESVNYEDPLISQYEQCLKKGMMMENTTSEKDVFILCPQLKMALNCIKKSNQLKSKIHAITSSPAPDLNQNQANELNEMREQVKDLREEAKGLLEQIQFESSMYVMQF